MRITINNKTFDLHYSFRMGMLYEDSTEKPITPETKITQRDVVILFYAAVKATWEYNNEDLYLTWEQFCNWIDDNGGEWIIKKFSDWYEQAIKAQTEKIKQLQKEDKESSKKK